MRKPARIVLLAIVALLLAPQARAVTEVYAMDDFGSGRARPWTIAIVPVRAAVSQQKLVVAEEMIAESQALEDLATRQIAAQIERQGYGVRTLSREEIAGDAALAEDVRRFEQRYDEVRAKVMREPSKARKGRYTLGDDARLLARRLGVDALVTGRMDIFAVASGRIAVSIAMGVGSLGYSYLGVAVMDGGTGAVQAWFRASTQATTANKLENEPEKLVTSLVEDAFEFFPGVEQSLVFHELPGDLMGQVGASARNAGTSPYELVPMPPEILAQAKSRRRASDDEVISDLEQLLGSPAPADPAKEPGTAP